MSLGEPGISDGDPTGDAGSSGSYSPTPTTDRLPVSGVGDEDTVDIMRHCSLTTG
jgi:hypothetical protein